MNIPQFSGGQHQHKKTKNPPTCSPARRPGIAPIHSRRYLVSSLAAGGRVKGRDDDELQRGWLFPSSGRRPPPCSSPRRLLVLFVSVSRRRDGELRREGEQRLR